MEMKKFALVSFGNEESYGLLYVGAELKKYGEIKFFDAEFDECVSKIIDYKPDYICFSPMTTFFQQAKDIENKVKEKIDVVSIYGGHHASNSGKECGDLTIVGSIHGIDLNKRGIINNGATRPENLVIPVREEYYRDIPRMKNRYRKIMLSVAGCPFDCSYCSSSSSNNKRMYGDIKCMLKHRDMQHIIDEAKYIKPFTQEIEWVDDDILFGDQKWLYNFLETWQREISLPMYVSTTSISAIRCSDKVLKLMRKSVNCVGLGVQASRTESLKLLGRGWDNEAQLKKAYDRLVKLGFRVNLQAIVGLPIKDPVEDALDTVEALKRIGTGSIVSVYPLQIYPNTKIEQYSKENGYILNKECEGDTNTGMPAIDFGYKTNNRLRNICKLATMVVKYGIDRKWLEAMMDIDLKESSQEMSMIRYYECIKDRLPDKADKIFGDIISTMHLRS